MVMFFWSSSRFASSWVYFLLDSRALGVRELMGVVMFFWIRELLGCYVLLDFRGCTAHSVLLSWFLRLFLPSQLFDRSRIRGVLSGSTGKIVLCTVRHLAQLARLPSSFLSSLTLRQPGGRVRSSDTQLGTKGLVSIVRSIRLLFAGTRYWVLEYLLAKASDFAIPSGPW